MFNQQSFNTGAFNIGSDDLAVFLQTDAYETVTGMFGVAVVAYFTTNASESVTNTTTVNAGLLLSESAEELVTGEWYGVGAVMMIASSEESVSSAAAIGSLFCLSAYADEEITSESVVGADLYQSAASAENITCGCTLGCVMAITDDAYEIVTSTCSIFATESTEMSVDVTLAPGDVLVIDSANLNVYLNNVNVVARHSGDWAWIERNTVSVRIDTGTAANLNSSIMYQERWL